MGQLACGATSARGPQYPAIAFATAPGLSPITSHASLTPWSVLQDGRSRQSRYPALIVKWCTDQTTNKPRASNPRMGGLQETSWCHHQHAGRQPTPANRRKPHQASSRDRPPRQAWVKPAAPFLRPARPHRAPKTSKQLGPAHEQDAANP